MKASVAQSCSTLLDPMDYSLPGNPIHGIFQARILEWVIISFSRGSSQPGDWTRISCTAGKLWNIEPDQREVHRGDDDEDDEDDDNDNCTTFRAPVLHPSLYPHPCHKTLQFLSQKGGRVFPTLTLDSTTCLALVNGILADKTQEWSEIYLYGWADSLWLYHLHEKSFPWVVVSLSAQAPEKNTWGSEPPYAEVK